MWSRDSTLSFHYMNENKTWHRNSSVSLHTDCGHGVQKSILRHVYLLAVKKKMGHKIIWTRILLTGLFIKNQGWFSLTTRIRSARTYARDEEIQFAKEGTSIILFCAAEICVISERARTNLYVLLCLGSNIADNYDISSKWSLWEKRGDVA